MTELNFNSIIGSSAAVIIFTTILPLLGIIALLIFKKLSIKPMLIGILTFFIAQIILRTQIMRILSTAEWYRTFVSTAIGVIIIGGLTAGIFEEGGRFLAGKFLIKGKLTFKTAISFGIGHAMCEIILLVAMSNINTIMTAILIQNGTYESLMAAQNIPAETIANVYQVLATVTPSAAFFAIIERVSAVGLHIFMTVLVFKGINEKKIRYLIFTVLTHTVANSVVTLVSGSFGLLIAEICFFVFVAILTFFTMKLKKSFPAEQLSANHKAVPSLQPHE